MAESEVLSSDAEDRQGEPIRARSWARSIIRLIVAGAVIALLCVAGYRRGFQRGYKVDDSLAGQTGSLYVVSYPVGDLVLPVGVFDAAKHRTMTFPGGSSGPVLTDFDSLIDLIVSTIEHDSWMESGTGEGEIQPFPTNLSLVISQTKRVHDQVADLLEQLRQFKSTVRAQEIVPMLQSRAAYGRDGAHPVRTFPATTAGRTALAPLFGKAVQNLVELWGPPEFRGDAEDAEFPSWSTAQQVASWRRGGGIAYVALQDDGHSEPQLLAGWRRN